VPLVVALLTAAMLAAGACAPTPAPTPAPSATLARPTRTPPPPATPIPTQPVRRQGLPLPTERSDLFAGSGLCAICHQSMLDDAGQDVSIDRAWRGSMMAQSARDPYWRASVQAEAQRHPEQAAVIETACARCHMPMAQVTLQQQGEPADVLGEQGLLDPAHPLHNLAMDGVSCTLCHQIQEQGLGLPESYSGGFVIDTETPAGKRLIFGPYLVEPAQSDVMEITSGYLPVQGLHVIRSEMCATCHTLYTEPPDGSAEAFPEQVPYLEWYYSSYRRTHSCQDCHMPPAEGGVRIAVTSPYPRSPFSQHTFSGGNAYMLGMLQTFADELQVTADGEHLQEARDRTLELLQEQSASLSIEALQLSGTRLTVEVRVKNQAGHKLPTGFPARRAWLRFQVTDATGAVVFESGAVDAEGRIAGNDADEDPTRFEPHYLAIVQTDQVQIYEAVLGDSAGQATTGLMQASQYLKDNRLLPVGLDPGDALESIRPVGQTTEDPDFFGGEDSLQYAIDLAAAPRPFTVQVQLLFQSIGYRWAQNLRELQGDQIEQFLRFYEAVPNTPVVLAEVSEQVGGP
jgi:hypothetical protein